MVYFKVSRIVFEKSEQFKILKIWYKKPKILKMSCGTYMHNVVFILVQCLFSAFQLKTAFEVHSCVVPNNTFSSWKYNKIMDAFITLNKNTIINVLIKIFVPILHYSRFPLKFIKNTQINPIFLLSPNPIHLQIKDHTIYNLNTKKKKKYFISLNFFLVFCTATRVLFVRLAVRFRFTYLKLGCESRMDIPNRNS
uniref:Uncharacterized protein n=1 Tax=Heterorhabditis bacteriophora TaxID=37862 RepID=A0A1I7W5Z4_HETBA